MEYTPQELSAILFYHFKDKENRIKHEDEMKRIQTFLEISVHVPSKKNLTYDKFKRIWPFPWEKSKSSDIKEDNMAAKQWRDLIKKPIISSKQLTKNFNIEI